MVKCPCDLPSYADSMYFADRSCQIVPLLLYETWPGPFPAFGHAYHCQTAPLSPNQTHKGPGRAVAERLLVVRLGHAAAVAGAAQHRRDHLALVLGRDLLQRAGHDHA